MMLTVILWPAIANALLLLGHMGFSGGLSCSCLVQQLTVTAAFPAYLGSTLVSPI